MSGSAVSPSRTCSPIRFSVARSASPAIATLMTWNRDVTSWTTGLSTSSGNVSIASTLALTSSRILRTSYPTRSSSTTSPTPSLAVDVIFLMPSIPCSASSSRRQIASSTSSGPAPRYRTSTVITSRENSGKISCFRSVSTMAPLATMTSSIRFAATPLRANQPMTPFTLRPLQRGPSSGAQDRATFRS